MRQVAILALQGLQLRLELRNLRICLLYLQTVSQNSCGTSPMYGMPCTCRTLKLVKAPRVQGHHMFGKAGTLLWSPFACSAACHGRKSGYMQSRRSAGRDTACSTTVTVHIGKRIYDYLVC